MKKIFIAVIILLIVGYCLYSGYLLYRNHNLQNSREQRILLAYNKSSLRNSAYILKAYESVLAEEGIPFEKVEIHTLMKLDVKTMLQNTPAVIFPDGLVQHVPEELDKWMKEYLNNSGNIVIIYDAGIKTPMGYYLKKATFSDIIGINYITYNKHREDAYAVGLLQFASIEKADYFEIPVDKIDNNLFLIDHVSGKLRFPIARCENTKSIPETNVFAHVLTEKGEKYPAIIIETYGRTNILYVNLNLGHLAATSDSILLGRILKAFFVKNLNMSNLLVNTISLQK